MSVLVLWAHTCPFQSRLKDLLLKKGESSNNKYCEGFSLFSDSSIDFHMGSLRCEARCYYICCPWRIKQLTEKKNPPPRWPPSSQLKRRRSYLKSLISHSSCLLHKDYKCNVIRMYSMFNCEICLCHNVSREFWLLWWCQFKELSH